MLKTLHRIVRGIGFLAATWIICTFVTSFALSRLRPVECGELTCHELLTGPIAPRVSCELTGYHTDQQTFDLSILPADAMGQQGFEWYVPIVPVEALTPVGLADANVLLKVHEKHFEALESGTIRVQARYPQTDLVLLTGSGDSALLAQHEEDVSAAPLWILEVVGANEKLATWHLLMPFVIAFAAACLALAHFGPELRRTRPKWLVYGGLICLSLGLSLVGFEYRFDPLLNVLRPGTGAFLAVCGLTVMLRGMSDRAVTGFMSDEKESVQALIDGRDDARIVILPDSVRAKRPDGSTIEILDEQVTGVVLRQMRHVNKEGEFESFRSWLTLQFDAGSGQRTIKVEHWFQADQSDPLDPLSDRLEISISRRWIERINAGQEIETQGWILGRHALRRARFWGSREVRIDEIRDIVDDGMQLKVYREQDPDPCITMSRAKSHTHVIKRTLRSLLEQRGHSQQPVEHLLGPVLFQRRLSLHTAVGPLLAVSVTVLITLWRAEFDLWSLPGAAICGSFGVMLTIAAAWTAGGSMQMRKHGLVVRRWWRDHCFRWRQIESMTWNRQRIESHCGIAVGESLSVRLTANDDGDRRRVSFDERYVKDHQLEDLQERLSQAIADRMQDELLEDGHCQWTPRLRFTRDGLQSRCAFGFGSGQVYHYGDIEVEQLSNGSFRLGNRGDLSPFVRLPQTTANLYPGLELLRRLISSASEPASLQEHETVGATDLSAAGLAPVV